MNTVTTNVSFVKLLNEKSKRATIFWQKTATGLVEKIVVYTTDSNYENGKEIPDADITALSGDGSVGFQFEFPIPCDENGALQAYDFYFQIISTVENKSEVVYDIHSFYKPDGNPGSEGDGAKPVKP